MHSEQLLSEQERARARLRAAQATDSCCDDCSKCAKILGCVVVLSLSIAGVVLTILHMSTRP